MDDSMDNTTWQLWREFVCRCGIDLAVRPVKLLQQLYLDLLAANSQTNLTRITDEVDYWFRHVADSLAIGLLRPELLQPGGVAAGYRVADVGCGGGFPILPLSWANPQLAITGIECRGKKTAFIEEELQRLGLTRSSVLTAQAREAARLADHGGQYDLVLLRAVGTSGKMLKECRGLLKPTAGSCMISYKTPSAIVDEQAVTQREADKYGFAVSVSEVFSLPLGQGERQFCVLTRME